MDQQPDATTADRLVAKLRAAGCVFAEDETALLIDSASDAEHLTVLTARRVAGEPLEQVIGWVDFGGLRLSVGPGVFVPRQRSLHLARLTVGEALGRSRPVVMECCCGVAPIAASVEAAGSGPTVIVTDASDAALVHARRNLVSEHVYCGDLFNGLPPQFIGQLDVIAAVPPYVPDHALTSLPREARDHEPTSALTSGVDGLDATRQILAEARRWLTANGVVLLEMNTAQLEAAAEAARLHGLTATGVPSGDGQTSVLRAQRS